MAFMPLLYITIVYETITIVHLQLLSQILDFTVVQTIVFPSGTIWRGWCCPLAHIGCNYISYMGI